LNSNNWMQAIVCFRDPYNWDNRRKLALQFIKPTINELWYDEAIVFFHYFFEPALHLRLYSEKDNFQKIQAIIVRNLKPHEKDLVRAVQFKDYKTGFDAFLEQTGNRDAWFVGRDFFMENSGTALHFLEILDEKTLFSPTNWMFDRFIHSFCNQLGFTNIEEGRILFEYSVYRATVEARKRNNRDEVASILEDLDRRLKSLRDDLLSK